MTFCLQECLRAVGLQHHYARLTSVGICRAAHLSALTMEDFPILGIRSMEDRTRLFNLIQVVKTLDLESLEYEDDDAYNYDCGDPNEDIFDDEDENSAVMIDLDSSTRVRRRLDFNSENTDQSKELFKSVQSDSNDERVCVCNCKEYKSHRLDVQCHQSDHHTRADVKPDTTGGTSVINPHIRLSPQCASKPRPAAGTSQKFSNKQRGKKDRRCISRKEKESDRSSEHVWNQTPIYESKRTAGYNYGLPLGSPVATHKKQPGGQRISVCVRKRPITHAEFRRGEADVITTPSRDCVIVHESKEAVDLTQYILQHRFFFDQVFGEESTNDEVYQRTAYPLVQHMLNGGNATCFAYGQTGAGKTHTMLGSSSRRLGLYALAVRDIFTHLSSMHSPLQVYVSFFEIYCGQLYDLLDHRKRLFAREDGQKVVHIAGLRDVRVDSVSSLLEVITRGTEERTQGVSGVNPFSSRSHALLQIQLRGPNKQVAGRMWFVDLAGSERASDTKEPDRQSRLEGAEINQSLLALKECIRSLDQEQSHTPFRQSKLTQVLKDSFVGDSMTCMIANISPGHSATEHTLNTLRYADRVKELKGQGGLRAGRRGKTSPKRNLSKSNSSAGSRSSGGSSVSIRGKSPPKKPKLGWQKEAPVPAINTWRSATGGPISCSTPKNIKCKEETSAGKGNEFGLEGITPVRGLFGAGERYKETDSAGHQNIRESKFYQRRRESQQLTQREEVEKEERRQIQICGDSSVRVKNVREKNFSKYDERDKEKVMHLKQYHKQLQQFTPLSTTTTNLGSPSTCLSFSSSTSSSLSSSVSSLQHSSQLSCSALTYQGLEEVLDAYGGEVEVRIGGSRGQKSSVPCEIKNEIGRVKREDSRPSGLEEEGERKWAWASVTKTGGMAGAAPAAVGEQVFYNCDSKERRGMGEVPADDLWSNEEHESNNLFTNPAVESCHHRAPAERPLSPSCEHINTLLTLNKLPLRLNHNRSNPTSSNLHASPQKSMTAVPTSSLKETKLRFSAAETTNEFSNAQSDTLSLTNSEAKTTTFPQGDTFTDVMDPLSISLLQVDQQAATASFLQGKTKTSSICLSDHEKRGESKRGRGNEHIPCLETAMNDGEDEEFCLSHLDMAQGKTSCSSSTNEQVHNGIMKIPIPKAALVSLQDQDINHKPQTIGATEVLSQQNPLQPSTMAAPKQAFVIQSTSSSVQLSRSNVPPSPHNLMTVSATQMVSGCAQNVPNKPFSSTTTPSESVLVQLKASPKQCPSVYSVPSSNSNISVQPNDQTESNFKESTRHHKTGNMIEQALPEDMDIAQWRVVQAHWEQLEEMEALFHKEGTLLCQQPDMAFAEYVQKLQEIMMRKAQCVNSMIIQLQPYLKFYLSNSTHNHNQKEDNHDPNT